MIRLSILLTLGLLAAPLALADDDLEEGAGCEDRGPGGKGRGPDVTRARGFDRHGGGRPDPAALLRDNADTIGLTEAQLAAVDAIFAEARPELEALHAAARTAREAARAEDATEAQEDAAHAAGEALRDARRAALDAVRAELTEEQWEAAQALMPRPMHR